MAFQKLKNLLRDLRAVPEVRRGTSVILAAVGPLHALVYSLLSQKSLEFLGAGLVDGAALGWGVLALFFLLAIIKDLGWRIGKTGVAIATFGLTLLDLYLLPHSPLWLGLVLFSAAAAFYQSISRGMAATHTESLTAIMHTLLRGFLLGAVAGVVFRDGYGVELGASGDLFLAIFVCSAFLLGCWLDYRKPLIEGARWRRLLWVARLAALGLLIPENRQSLMGLMVLPDLWVVWMQLWSGRFGQYVRVDVFRNPPLLMVGAFGSVILVGALLLSVPASARSGVSIGLLPALFMSTSAVCVTGLSVLDVGVDLSFFGQVVLLTLVQLGGLGIITFSVIVAVLVGARMGVEQTWAFADLAEQFSPRSMRKLFKSIVVWTLALETLGAMVLAVFRLPQVGDWGEALWFGIFHGVSAFCNAGFTLQTQSLEAFRHDPAILMPIAVLVLLGGLGFVPLSVIAFRILGFRPQLNLHTQVALVGTGCLFLGGGVAFWVFQAGSVGENTSVGDALFWSVTLRTAGFNNIPMDSLTPAATLLSMGLMFVGGCPGGTSGGVKVTTVALLLLAVRSLLRDEYDIQVSSRTVPRRIVIRALVVVVLSGVLVFLGSLALLANQPDIPFISLAFETVSAFGTVGLSLGVTDKLDSTGMLVIMVLMFVGRIGPLSVAYGVGRSKKLPWKGALEEIHVG